MAGATEKVQQGTIKGIFTRAKGTLTELIEREADNAMITDAKDVMMDVFARLEEANITFLTEANIDIEVDPNSVEALYMEAPTKIKIEALFAYGEICTHGRKTEVDEQKNRAEIEKERKLVND